MSKIKLLFLLFTIASYASNTSSRLDALEAHNAKLVSTLEASQKALMQQELNNKNLESKIDELNSKLEKLKNTQDDYRIEKSSYDFKMKSNTDLVAAQEKRLSDIIFYFTLLLGLFGVATYLKAKHDAKETAEEFIRQWIDNEATPHLDRKITEVLNTKDDEIDSLIEEQIQNKVEPLLASVKASLKDVEALVKDVEVHKDKAKETLNEMDNYVKKIQDTFEAIPKEELETIEAKEPSSLTSDEHYKLGVSAIKDAKFNTALNEFEQAIKLADAKTPEVDRLHYAKGLTLFELKKYDNAIEAYKQAIEINPKHDRAYNNMGVTYYHLHLFDKAMKALTEALKINLNESEIYTNLFELQLTQNQAFDEILEKEYIKRFKEQKESFIKYEMLKVLQNIQNSQASQLEQWQENYREISIDVFSFSELRTWIEPMEENETKTKLLEALEVFEGHG